MAADGLLILNSQNLTSSIAPYNRLVYQFAGSTALTDHEIALSSISIYNSWPNISSALYQNNTFAYQWVDGGIFPVVLPQGLYQVSDIQNYWIFVMQTNGHFLVNSSNQNVFYAALTTNPALYGVSFTSVPLPTSLPAGWKVGTGSAPAWSAAYFLAGLPLGPQLQLNATPFNLIIGFAPSTNYPVALPTANYVANSTFAPELSPAPSVIINCSLTNFGLSLQPTAIFSFSPTVGGGSQIFIDVAKLIYLPVIPSTLSSFNLTITDEMGNALPVLDPAMTIILALRRRGGQP